MPYQSNDSSVAALQLKVQELNVKLADVALVSVSANDVTIDVKQPIKEIRLATFFDDSAGTNAPVAAASQVISGNTVKLSVGAALASADSISLKYVISE